MRRLLIALVAAAGLALCLAPAALAQDVTAPPTPPASYGGLIDRLSPECRDKGNCDFCDVLDGFTILTRWILGLSGALALALFVWFGFQFIISNGNAATVGAARKGMVGTVVGLAIIFGGWEIINLVLYAAVTSSSSSSINNAGAVGRVTLFPGSTPWYEYCASRKNLQGPDDKPPANIPGITGN